MLLDFSPQKLCDLQLCLLKFFFFNKIFGICYTLSLFLGLAISLLGKNITLYVPDKKGNASAILGFEIMIITATFALSGEKIINFEGYTLVLKTLIFTF